MAQQNRIGSTATKVRNINGRTEVQYHYTIVVEFTPVDIRLDSGGWRTATTKTRMNQTSRQYGLGFSVFQVRGAWFVDYAGERLPFADGMLLNREAIGPVITEPVATV
jgi:hypothetical protein